MMVGRAVDQIFPKRDQHVGDEVLQVVGYAHPTEFADISFTLHKGEILGFYGLVGAGRSELMQALFGITKPSKGVIRIDGQVTVIRSPADAVAQRHRLCARGSRQAGRDHRRCRSSRTSRCRRWPAPRATGSCGWPRNSSWRATIPSGWTCAPPRSTQDVGNLSGGNQQKVVIAKWLATQPKVIILDEPTKGIDIGSKAAVHEFMAELAAQGLAVIMVSSEIPEVLGMSDRVIVMREGRIVAELAGDDADPRNPGPPRRGHRGGMTDAQTLHSLARGDLAGGDPGAARADRHRGFRPLSRPANLANVFNDTSPLIILALGQMVVILTHCIDLSVAANLALTGMVVAMLNIAAPGLPIPVILLVAAGARALRWARSTALLVWKLRIPPIVVTLGTMTIYRGIIFLISDGKWVNAHEMSPAFKAFPRAGPPRPAGARLDRHLAVIAVLRA